MTGGARHTGAPELPIAPSLQTTLDALPAATRDAGDDRRRVVWISALAVPLAAVAALVGRALLLLINLITSLAFHGTIHPIQGSPLGHHLGIGVVLVPVVGGVVVGLMARWGSAAIRGHGIPEAMEQILTNRSRIPPRLTLLKPLSAAIAIGTGGPFGAEGPIIATGGALGSLAGQVLPVTADERKILLACGAAAGMSAIFGTPVAAVLLAIELLLFEYRARSLVPVALAAATAAGVRIAFTGATPVFPMPEIVAPRDSALAAYIVLGVVVGLFGAGLARAVYLTEDAFERLPMHWMWWPALGGIAVGVIGAINPATLGVGYDNITGILSGSIAGVALLSLVLLKTLSWTIALGSGTSGGTLAPLFTIGGGAGALCAVAAASLWPGLGLDPRVAALVGMASVFAGASRALLTSVVFAFEATRQPLGLLPILGGCAGAYLASLFVMRHTIMTERLARRGTRVPADYSADFLAQVPVREVMSQDVVTLRAGDTVGAVRSWLAAGGRAREHQGYPVVDGAAVVRGVLTRRDLLAATTPDTATIGDLVRRPPEVVSPDASLRDAADRMVHARIGRLVVVDDAAPGTIVGIVTRSDLLGAHAARLDAGRARERVLTFGPAASAR